jgi:hypothetical protein
MIPATGSREILQERCGKVTGSFRKTPEIAGTWKQYSDRKSSEKIRKFPGRNTASTKSPELLGTSRFQAGLFDLRSIKKNKVNMKIALK